MGLLLVLDVVEQILVEVVLRRVMRLLLIESCIVLHLNYLFTEYDGETPKVEVKNFELQLSGPRVKQPAPSPLVAPETPQGRAWQDAVNSCIFIDIGLCRKV